MPGLLLPVAAGLLLCVGYVIYRFAYAPFQVLKHMKGPKPSFFFGNYKQMSKLGWPKFYELLFQKYGPVCGFYLGRQPYVMVADPEILKQILAKQYEAFLSRPFGILRVVAKAANSPRSIFLREGEDWKRTRQILSPTFSSMKIKTMAPHVKKVCDSLVKRFGESVSSDNSVNVLEVYGLFTMQSILACVLGREVNILQGEGDHLTAACAAFFSQGQENQELSMNRVHFVLDNFPFLQPLICWLLSKTAAIKGSIMMREIISSIMNTKRESGETRKFQDMLQLMMDAQAGTPQGGQKLTDGEIVINAFLFLLAGYETTANTLAYTSYLLALHPSVQDRLHSEIEEYFENNPGTSLYDATMEIQYLDMVVNETMRVHPVVPRLPRECLKTTEINGVTFTKGTVVHVPVYLLHHNPEHWPDPERFDPERFTPAEKAKRPHLSFVPFAWGPMNCIGMRFALLEIKMALIEILRKYKFVRAPDTEVPLQTIVGLTVIVKNGIYLKIKPRD